jgi:hypothetical protein
MHCTNCGSKLEMGSIYCPDCGTKTSEVDSNKQDIPAETTKYKGIGGWLILLAFGMLYSLYISGATIYGDLNVFSASYYPRLNDPSSQYYVGNYSATLGIELVAYAILFAGLIYILYLFFEQKREFPKYYIYFLLAVLVIATLEYFMISSLTFSSEQVKTAFLAASTDGSPNLLRAIIGCVIWIPYMQKSQRVRETFIN